MTYIFLIVIYAFIMNIIFYVFIPTHNTEYTDEYTDEYTEEYTEEYTDEEDTENLLKNNEERWNII